MGNIGQRANGRCARTVWTRAAVLCAVQFLVACAGGDDFLEPAEPSGHHPFPERASTTGHSAHRVHGIDIAKYQGNIDWHAVKRSGVTFAFIKATEGTDRLDSKFAQNWAAAKAAGVARGAYHFNYWCTPFRDQFNWFRRNVPRDKDALPPVLDLEWNTHSPTCPRKVSREQAKREIRTFVRLAEAWYGKRPIIYTDIRFYRDVLSDGSFAQYPLWVRATRRLPQDIYKGRKWVFWQYSDRLRVPGIRGRVDKNAFAGSRSDWKQLAAANFIDKRKLVPKARPDKPGKQDKQDKQDKPGRPVERPVAVASAADGKGKAGKAKAANVTARNQAVRAGAKPVRASIPITAGKPLALMPLNLPKKN